MWRGRAGEGPGSFLIKQTDSHKVANIHIMKLPEASLVLLTFVLSFLLGENYYAFASPTTSSSAFRGAGRKATTTRRLSTKTSSPSEAPSNAAKSAKSAKKSVKSFKSIKLAKSAKSAKKSAKSAKSVKSTDAPTDAPTDTPTDSPTNAPTDAPTDAPHRV